MARCDAQRHAAVPQLAMVHDFVVSAGHLISSCPPYDMQSRRHGAASPRCSMRWQLAMPGRLRALVVAKAQLHGASGVRAAGALGFPSGECV
jgi:carotenoid cleavage dioxygenase-like enzyme